MDMMWYRRRGLMVTPHIERVTGAIASFNSDYNKIPVKSLICDIEPIQEGTGDPSPENVRPISGRTGLSVVRCGKNLLPMPIVSGSYDYTATITVNDDKSFVINKTSGNGWSNFILGRFTLKPGTYTLIESDDGNTNAQLVLDKVIGDTTEVLIAARYLKRQVLTVEADTLVQARYVRSAPADNVLTKLMLFVGNTATATDYEPYKGNTYSVNWETEAGTVYGGTLDVVSGKLTMDSVLLSFDGTEAWDLISSAAYLALWGNPSSISNNDLTQISNYLTGGGGNYTIFGKYRAQTNGAIVIGNITNNQAPYTYKWETATDFKAYLAEHPLQVCYKIATPTEIQLTPQEVRTLLGENNIWCDSGDVSVDYWKWGK